MALPLSPAVTVNEIDMSLTTPAVSTSIGAIAGAFEWGPVKEFRIISNEAELVNVFGKPNNAVATTFFSAANFLAYNGNLKVVRVSGASGLNATSSGSTGILVENETDYTQNHSTGISNTAWIAKYPGALGNSLKVSVCDKAAFATWTYKSDFQSAPGTSGYAGGINQYANDEIHIVVLDEDGDISGTAGTILEKYSFVSKAANAKTETGSSNYYKDVINRTSRWIWWGNHISGATGPGTSWGSNVPGATGFAGFGATAVSNSLLNGVSSDSLTSAEEITGYDIFKNDAVDVNFIVTGAPKGATVIDIISNLVETRKDCMVFISPEIDDVVDNAGQEVTDITAFRDTLNSSTYAVLDGNWKYQYDKYNDVFRWIPLNGDVAGLCAKRNTPWESPAGLTKGFIKNVIKLAWSPTLSSRDALYNVGVNPVVNFTGQGTVLFGDKTMTSKPSAFDRINVRTLFIYLEKRIAASAKYTLFEINDEISRNGFVGVVEPLLRDVQGQRGIYDFSVVCDDTNNTPEVIDTDSFIADIFIKPAKSINFITLNFIATRTGFEFATRTSSL